MNDLGRDPEDNGISRNQWLNLLDPAPVHIETKGGFGVWNPKRIIITSNFPPESVFGGDDAWLRRLRDFGKVIDMTNLPPYVSIFQQPKQDVNTAFPDIETLQQQLLHQQSLPTVDNEVVDRTDESIKLERAAAADDDDDIDDKDVTNLEETDNEQDNDDDEDDETENDFIANADSDDDIDDKKSPPQRRHLKRNRSRLFNNNIDDDNEVLDENGNYKGKTTYNKYGTKITTYECNQQ